MKLTTNTTLALLLTAFLHALSLHAQVIPLAPDAKPLRTLSIICAYDGIPESLAKNDPTIGPDGPIDFNKKVITVDRVNKAMIDLDPFIREYSFGKTYVVNKTVTQLIRVPYPLGSVEEDKPAEPRGIRSSHKVTSYVISEVRKLNYNLDEYDCFVFFYPHTEGRTYGGLGGQRRYPGFTTERGFVGMEADTNVPIIAHEVLHSSSQTTQGAGLPHGNSWKVTDGNPLSSGGSHIEYGDIYDVMGSGQSFESHPNPAYKLAKKWMLPENVHTVATSGTYRIYRFDHRDALGFDGDATKLAIKIRRETDGVKKRDIWVGYRRLVIPDWKDSTLGLGAYITWDQKLNTDADDHLVAQTLIDTQTPGALAAYIDPAASEKSSFLDAALPVGKTLKDDAPVATRPAPIYITPIAQGGTAPAEYLDVVVNIGPFSGNVAPVLTSITPPSGPILAGIPVQLTANATDGNGDPLAYYWEFTAPGAKPQVNVSSATRTHTFATGGTYTVRCTVTDMKGGESTRTETITVADALTTWTARASTIDSPISGIATLGNTVVAVVGEHGGVGCVRSVDGLAWKQHRIGTDLADPNCGLRSVAAGDGKFVAAGWKAGTNGLVGYVATSPDGITWTSRNIPAVGHLRSVYFSTTDSRFYAVGDGGGIITSTDGQTWEQQNSGTTKDLLGVTHGPIGYMAVGKEGTVLISTDATTWQNVSHDGFGTNFQRGQAAVAASANVYVLFSDSRYVVTSEDGKKWIKRSLPVETDYELRNVIFANGNFFAIGNKFPNGVRMPITVQSPDGISWVERASADVGGNPRIALYGNTYLCAGDGGKISQSGSLVAGVPSITSASSVDGANNVPFTYQIVATNSPSSFSATGLPGGFTLNQSTGRITGSAGIGSSSVTLRATNASGSSTDFTLALNIKAPSPSVTSPSTATATPGQPFNFTVQATNTPTNFSATGLPTTLSIHPTTGVISGTPTQHEKATIKLTVTNAAGSTVSDLLLTVGTPVITSPLQASGVVGQAFTNYIITATSTIEGNSVEGLPAGLQFDDQEGRIFGTPTTAGIFPVKLIVNTAAVPVSAATLTITIGTAGIDAAVGNAPAAAPLQPLRTPLVAATTIQPAWTGGGDVPPFAQAAVTNEGDYAVQFGNIGDNETSLFQKTIIGPGTLRFFWKVSSQFDADFLTLDITGNTVASISGEQDWEEVRVEIPDGEQTVTFAYTKDASISEGADTGWVDNVDFYPGAAFPEITSASAATGSLGASFVYQITATRDPEEFFADGLPDGLSVDETSGLISGVPLESGNFYVTLTATNSVGESAALELVLDIAGPAPVIFGDLDIDGEVDEDRFVYQIKATGSPTSFSATGLPEGFRVDRFSGEISGRPVESGVFAVTITASNENGTGTATLTLTFAPREVDVEVPRQVQAYPGIDFELEFETHDSVDSFSATGLPPGLIIDPDQGHISGIPTTPGVYTVVVTATTNAGSTDFEFTFTVGAKNDSFANRIEVEGTTFGAAEVSNGATTETGEPVHAGNAGATRTLWWTWTAPRSGRVILSVDGGDSVIAAYQGSAVDSLSEAGTSTASNCEFDAIAGNTYQIAVAAAADGDVSFTGRFKNVSDYNGLIQGSLVTTLDGLGSVKVTDKLAFTGKLQIAGKKYSVKGTFDSVTGGYSGTITRKGLPSLTLNLTLDFGLGTDAIIGDVTDGTDTASIWLQQAQSLAKGTNSPQMGQYTLAIHSAEGLSEQTEFAQGSGFGTVTIAKTGKLKFAGKLGDGSKVSQGSAVAGDGTWAFFVPSAKTGSALGWVYIENTAPALHGNLTWTKPSTLTGPYTAGFILREIPLEGSLYQAPGKGSKPLAFSLGTLSLGTSDRIAFLNSDGTIAAESAKVKFTAKTGLFSGTFFDGTNTKRTFEGAILQSQQSAFGEFVNGSESVAVKLVERP